MEELKIGKFYKLTREFCNDFKLTTDICKVWAIKGSSVYFQNNNENFVSAISYFGNNIIDEKMTFTTSATAPVQPAPVQPTPVQPEPVQPTPEPVQPEPVQPEPEPIDPSNPYGEDYI